MGSSYTLSNRVGECTITTHSTKYYIKADILFALNEWGLIRKNLKTYQVN
jgi:hypothetical protein